MTAQAQTATISERDMEERLSFIGLDEASRADIRELAPLIERLLPKGLDAFYQKVRQQPEISKLFSGEGHIDSAKNAQLEHWTTITTGRFDEDYANKVRTIGSVHARIGLLPRWYIGGYTVLLEQLVRGVVAENWPRSGVFSKQNKTEMDAFQSRLVSLLKAILLDMELSISVYIDEADAMDHVAGYCVVNDVSEREFQIERSGTWDKGKGCDTFGPIGPWLVTRDEVADPQNLKMWLEVDGHRYQDGSTKTMVFGVQHLVSYVSQFMSLQPGDVISTGTPPGVGMGQKPQTYLKGGETIELGSEGLGQQRQSVGKA